MILLAESIYRHGLEPPFVLHWLAAAIPPVILFLVLSVCHSRRACGHEGWLNQYTGRASLYSSWFIAFVAVVLMLFASKRPYSGASLLDALRMDWLEVWHLDGSVGHGSWGFTVIALSIAWFCVSIWVTLLLVAIGGLLDEWEAGSAAKT